MSPPAEGSPTPPTPDSRAPPPSATLPTPLGSPVMLACPRGCSSAATRWISTVTPGCPAGGAAPPGA
eukprot:144-Chlamydomonas_euryale.AAC.1